MECKWIDSIIAFILGVISSIIAEVIFLYFNRNNFISKAIRMLVRRKSIERIKTLQRNSSMNMSDPHAVIRADWACALYDLGLNNQANVRKSINSLFCMADLLDLDEKDAAFDALRYRFGANQNHNLDFEYLKTMQKLKS